MALKKTSTHCDETKSGGPKAKQLRLRWPALVALAAAIGFTLTACAVMDDVRTLSALQKAIAAQYGELTAIGVSKGELNIVFQNSKYADLTGSERDKFVRGVADFAFANYARRDSISAVSVGFRSKMGIAGFSVTKREEPRSFATNELRAAMDSEVKRKLDAAAPSR